MDREANPANPPRRRSSRKEQPIKDFVVIIGFLMMFMCFGLLLEASLRAWNCPNEKTRAAVSCFGLLVFTALFLLYGYYRFRKNFLQVNSQDESQNVSSKDLYFMGVDLMQLISVV